MKLSNISAEAKKIPITCTFPAMKQLVADILKDLIANSDILNKRLSPEACTILSDCIAVGTLLNQNADKMDDKTYKISASRFHKTVTALFEEQFDYLELRKEVKEHQMALVKDIKPRSLEPQRILVDGWSEAIADNTTAKKTCSPIDPTRVAEQIMRDLSHRYYPNAQEAYEGYCQPHGIWQFASAHQKCVLGDLLRFFGFVIKNEDTIKEAQADRAEWFKIHKNYGKGERPAEVIPGKDSKIEEDFSTNKNVTAAKDIQYCNKCGKSMKGNTEGNGSFTCNACGTKKNPVIKPKKASLISMIRQEQIQNERPNILQIVMKKIKDKWDKFQQPISTYDVSSILNQEIESEFSDPSEAQEEKAYMMGNEAVNDQLMAFMRENNIPISTKISSWKTLREAVSKEAESWISAKIEYLIKEEGLSKEQAAGKAYGMAREKGFDAPKKSSFKDSLISKLSNGQVGLPADQDGIATNPQDNSTQTSMTKEGDMKCTACGYMMAKGEMQKTSDDMGMGGGMPPAMSGGMGGGGPTPTGMAAYSSACPKCGGLMKDYVDTSKSPYDNSATTKDREKFPYVDNQSNNPSNEFSASDAQPVARYLSDGSKLQP